MKCKVAEKVLTKFFFFVLETVRMIRTECTDAQIIEAASIWLAQATTREKRLQVKRRLEPQEQIVLEDEALEDNTEN